MVTDRFSIKDGCGLDDRDRPFLRYTDEFNKYCGHFLSLGMSLHEYWEEDVEYAKFYRDKERIDFEAANTSAWIEGLYIYIALCKVSPALNGFAKNPTPKPYLSKPVDLFGTKEEEKMKDDKAKVINWMTSFNAKFKKGGE